MFSMVEFSMLVLLLEAACLGVYGSRLEAT